MHRRSLFWLLQQLTGGVSPSGGSLSALLRGTLRWYSLKGLVVEGVAGVDPVPFFWPQSVGDITLH